MSKEFSIPFAPSFSRYLLENFGDDISLGSFTDTPTYSGVLLDNLKEHMGRIGPHSFEVKILLNGAEIGTVSRHVAAAGRFTVMDYHGILPCYYNEQTHNYSVSLVAHYQGEYALWDSLEGKVAERKDRHDSIPFP